MEQQLPWIYESPDGGNTIYRRRIGDSHKELHYATPEAQTMRELLKEDQLWVEIRKHALNDPELAEQLDRIKAFYILKHQ